MSKVRITTAAMVKFAHMPATFFEDRDDREAVVRDMASEQFNVNAARVCHAEGVTLVFTTREYAENFVAEFDEGDCEIV